eukprot:CAMPEP_0181313390 /NCGR_PEP_ID=MMETSP1101-20121128/14221_1 /TAXON_ID=46948 /ORGANISM="Rhodomonas abbreviata, Strain Caron Lab Isolate" /LENGTH=301 /DNA_ID=CAMNT_0023420337 /DNA_START=104 /DNA_END=1009 /DNA_ORIENTATION=-
MKPTQNDGEAVWVRPGQMSKQGTHYVLRGSSGRLVVCVHGIGSYSYCFDKIAKDLEKEGYRVLQYDLMGRGWSEPASNDNNYGGEGHVAQLQQLLEELHFENEPFDLIAHSMGGALAAHYLAKFPPNPAHNMRVVLLSPAGLMKPGMIKVLRSVPCMHSMIAKVLKSGQEGEWRKDFFAHTGEAATLEAEMLEAQRNQAQHNPHSFNAFFQSALRFPLYGNDDLVKDVGKMPIKTLIMWAKQDKAVPYSPSFARWQQALSEGGASVETETWDKAGHGFFLERPVEASSRIKAFLSSSSATV